MKIFTLCLSLLSFAALGTLTSCSTTPPKSIDVTESLRSSLARAGLKDVSVSQDLDKGVVTLSGHVTTDADKGQAESIAKSVAGSQVVANQIAIVPVGDSSSRIIAESLRPNVAA